jgi:hypothetical protein
MIKSLAYFVSLCVMLCVAQVALAQMKSDPTGSWGGSMTTKAGTSGLEITLARDRSGWHATMKLRAQGQEVAPVVQDLRINRADISFAAPLGRNLLKFAGKFNGDKLDGTVEVLLEEKRIRSGTFALTFGGAMPALQETGGQMADPDFNASVSHPAYTRRRPKVLFDEAHNNFHTASGRYKPFADLITNDGYQVVPNKQAFALKMLSGYRVLVISNALGAPLITFYCRLWTVDCGLSTVYVGHKTTIHLAGGGIGSRNVRRLLRRAY